MAERTELAREFFSVREVAAKTGLPAKTVYQFLEERRLDYVSFRAPGSRRGRVLIPVESLRKFLDGARVAARTR